MMLRCATTLSRRMYCTAAGGGMNALKEVRRMTGAGLLDCKKALKESENDIEEALKWLEKRGIAKADKRRGRAAAAGAVAAAHIVGPDSGLAIIELNSESDFVAKTSEFLKLLHNVQQVAAEKISTLSDKTVLHQALLEDEYLQKLITATIAKTGENIDLRRAAWFPCPEHGAVGFYIHNKVAANDYVTSAGITIAAASLAPTPAAAVKDPSAFTHTAAQLSQHLVAMSVSEDTENTPLREQLFMGSEKTVGGWLKSRGKAVGCKNITVVDTLFWRCGDGVEVKLTNFAEEVAQMAQV